MSKMALQATAPKALTDGCKPGAINMARIGWVQKIKLSLWDLFRWLHYESWSRRGPDPIEERIGIERQSVRLCCPLFLLGENL